MGSGEITAGRESRLQLGRMLAIAVVAALLGIALGLTINWFPVAATTKGRTIDTLWDVLIICSVPVFVLVVTVVLYCALKFRVRPGEERMDGPPIHGNTRLEVIWTAIPALMMFGLCAYAYVVLMDVEQNASAATPMRVRVVGEQFTWTFHYPGDKGQKEVTSNQLYLPKDQLVLFQVQTKDVLHDFWVPAFRLKIDAVPGITTRYRVTPNRVGEYDVVCMELCGYGHALMRQTAHVVERADFDRWIAGRRGGAAAGGGAAPAAGGGAAPAAGGAGDAQAKQLFTSGAQPACASCHTLADAGATATVGPNLAVSLKGKDAAYVRQSILDPNAQLAKGFEDKANIMPPNYGQTLKPTEIDALVKYLVRVSR